MHWKFISKDTISLRLQLNFCEMTSLLKMNTSTILSLYLCIRRLSYVIAINPRSNNTISILFTRKLRRYNLLDGTQLENNRAKIQSWPCPALKLSLGPVFLAVRLITCYSPTPTVLKQVPFFFCYSDTFICSQLNQFFYIDC